MSRVWRRVIWGFGLSASLWVTQVSIAYAATGSREEDISRPFNALWLIIFLMTIAVFLTMSQLNELHDQIEIREEDKAKVNQSN